MLTLSLRMLRHRIGSAVATVVALTCGVMILMAMGLLVESGLRFEPEPQRYAAADLVVADHEITITGQEFGQSTTTTVPLPEGGTVPVTLAEQLRQLPGVATAVAADSPHPGRAEAIEIGLTPDADRDAVKTEVGRLAADVGAEVYAGTDRGKLEQSDDLAASFLLIQLGAIFGFYVAALVTFVVAGTVGLAVRHRRRDLALLRAVAATPGQVRTLIVAEVAQLSLVSVALGVPAGLVAAHWLHGQLVSRGFIPDSFPLSGGLPTAAAVTTATLLVAVAAALVAARRTARIRPTEALGEISVEPPRNSRVRLVAGLIALGGGVALTGFSAAFRGEAALGAAIGMLYVFVLAAALLAPWINRFAARALGPALRAIWRDSGYLAAANLRANAQGMAVVLAALVLAVGFGGSVWFLQDNLQRETVTHLREGTLAQYALMSAAGLPETAAAEARELPGVVAATGVRRTSVLVRMMGDVEAVGAQVIDPDGAEQTMDLAVTEGSLADLRGATVALSTLQASSLRAKLGDQVELWLGDGTPVTLQLVAVYERWLGFGDVTLNRETVAGHTATDLDEQVLIRTEASGAGAVVDLVDRYPGSALVDTGAIEAELAEGLALSAWLNKLLIGVMVGYAALAAANTMVMAALARGRELALLRLVGVTRRQVKRMVHAEQIGLLGTSLLIGGAIAAITLSSVVRMLTGQAVPYVPTLGWISVIGGTTLLAVATTILPIGALLRTPPVHSIGVKE